MRADILYNHKNNELNTRFYQICKSIKDDWEFKYYESYWIQYRLNFLALILVDTIFFLPEGDKLTNIITSSFENKNQNSISLRIAIAKKVMAFDGLNKCIFKLLDEIDTLIQNSTLPSNEIVNTYIEIAGIATTIDGQVGKFYFDKGRFYNLNISISNKYVIFGY